MNSGNRGAQHLLWWHTVSCSLEALVETVEENYRLELEQGTTGAAEEVPPRENSIMSPEICKSRRLLMTYFPLVRQAEILKAFRDFEAARTQGDGIELLERKHTFQGGQEPIDV